MSDINILVDAAPIAISISAAQGPASGGAALESYVDDIESLADYPATFPPDVSAIADSAIGQAKISGLVTALSGKQAALTNYSTISGLTGYPSAFPPSTHTHTSAGITDATASGESQKLVLTDAGGGITATGGVNVTAIQGDAAAGFYAANSITLLGGGGYTGEISFAATLTADRQYLMPDATGKLALTASTTGVPDALHNGTISGTVTFAEGVAATFRTALKVAASDPAGITGAAALSNIVSLTQAQYDAIVSKSSTTLYVIT